MADESWEGLSSLPSTGSLSEPSTRRGLLLDVLLLSLDRFQGHFHDILQDQRHQLEALNDEIAAMNMDQRNLPPPPPPPPPAQHREGQREARQRQFDRLRSSIMGTVGSQDPHAAAQAPTPASTGLSASNLVRTRRRAFRPSERLTRSMRQRLASAADTIISNPSSSPSSSAVPSLLPRPLSPRPRPLDSAPHRDYSVSSAYDRDSRNSAKRRKLDDGTYDDQPRALTYGHKGQVVPGQLQLEIVSYDGGQDADPAAPADNSWPQAVLEHSNSSVYCPNSSRCNMLFKHSSGMPFALTKIVIKAPCSAYDKLVREGMVFVAMEDDSIVEKTAKYEAYCSSQAHRYHSQRSELGPSQEWNNATRLPLLRALDRSNYLQDPSAPGRHHADGGGDPLLASAVVPGFAVGTADPLDDDHEPLSRSDTPSPRPWHDADGEYSYRTSTDRYRPVYASALDEEPPRLRYDYLSGQSSDSEAEDSRLLEQLLRHTRRRSSRDPNTDLPSVVDFAALRRQHRRASQLASQENNEMDDDDDDDNNNNSSNNPPGYERLGSAEAEAESSTSLSTKARDEALAEARRVAAVDGHDALAPHARFSIPRDREGIAVCFDPPVAGRYILVKLWAVCPSVFLDIQNISAHGYGGPRYFPSIEMR